MNTKALVAEFIGTFALIFVGVGAIAMDQVTNGALGLTGIALAHGLTIAVMASATLAISGGQLNPAVTIGLWTTGKMQSGNAIAYILVQCAGALAAASLLCYAMPCDYLTAVDYGTPAPGKSVSTINVLVMEFVLTFFLMFVIYGTAVDKRAHKVAGLSIGLAVTLDIFAGGPISGAAMNPARHLGPAIFSGQLSNAWLYWLAPVLGSVAAAQVYHRVLEERS